MTPPTASAPPPSDMRLGTCDSHTSDTTIATRLLPPSAPVTRAVFAVSRRGGDRRPAVRVVLDVLAEKSESFIPNEPS
jgi:hypothetical protein